MSFFRWQVIRLHLTTFVFATDNLHLRNNSRANIPPRQMTSTSVFSGLWCGMLILMAFHCTRLYQLPRAAWSNKWPVPLTLQKQAPNKHRPVQLVDGQNLTYDKPTDILGWGGGEDGQPSHLHLTTSEKWPRTERLASIQVRSLVGYWPLACPTNPFSYLGLLDGNWNRT